MKRPRAIRLLQTTEKELERALVAAEKVLATCEADELGEMACETARLLVENLRDARDKLDHGRTRIVQAIAERRFNGG